MEKVKSKDGTFIAFERTGKGSPVVLVCGALCTRMNVTRYAEPLAESFTVFNYDRRGRGDSGDTRPYGVEREVEDIDAIINVASGPIFLFGGSSGGALCLETAYRLPTKIARLALYEVPYFVDDKYPRPRADGAKIFTDLVSAGKRGEAVEFFLTEMVGLPAEFLKTARKEPWWLGQEAIARTLAYDATIMGDYVPPRERIAAINIPTLVIDGGASPQFMHAAADAIARTLPNGQRLTLEGQSHDVAANALAPVLKQFFTEK
jgi:pimeloyl-ACP methyl ester carboxylesterase